MKLRSPPQMTIGTLAKAAGVGVETVRYYQRRGLLPQPARRDRQAAQRLAGQKIAEIDQRIDALRRLRQALNELTRACELGTGDIPCPILEAFRAPHHPESVRTRY
jgi:MerR family mercuric resistance operon transcriptional regulator